MFSQGSIPEVKEEAIGYALNERKQKIPQFQDLGPPDLITLVKYIPSANSGNGSKDSGSNLHGRSVTITESSTQISSNTTANGHSKKKSSSESKSKSGVATEPSDLHSINNLKGEIGTFFYSLGADTSDPTSIAIFLKTIADTISEQPQAWFGKNKNFNVARISFSTFNTFRKCDINVIVHIPGTLQTYILDVNGEQLQIQPQSKLHELIWAETFFSSIVRSLMLMKDNAEESEVQNLVETLIINPLTSGQIDKISNTFIDLFPLVYERGPLLGAPCHVTNVTRTNNYLIETLIEIIRLTKNIDKCRKMLEKLSEQFPEIISVLARIFMTNDLEIDAIKLINDTLENPIIDNNNPYKLDYTADLLCIQTEFLLNIKQDYVLAKKVAQTACNYSPSEFRPWYLLAKVYIKLNDVENALLTLNACPMAPLKEKYTLKRVVPIQSDANLHLPLPVDVILDEVSSLNPQDIQQEHKSADPALVNLAAANLKSTFQLAYKLLTEIVQLTGWEALLKYRSNIFVMEEEYQGTTEEIDKETTSNSATAHNTNTSTDQENNNNTNNNNSANDSTEATDVGTPNETDDINDQNLTKTKNNISSLERKAQSLRSKRLCERWLDNLFMLLYEDLKTYTLWQTEQLYFEAQNTKYNKLTVEWELFGLCARRLGHYPEAATAFQQGLAQRFSSDCARKLLEYYIEEVKRIKLQSMDPKSDMTSSQIVSKLDDLDRRIIDLCVKVCCWNHRWYIEYSTKLLDSMAVVVQDMSLTKVSNEISARYSESIHKLMEDNFLTFFKDYTNGYFDV
ncbi:hypothetical protein TBLA_0B03330 [Henningerozyma blattae CBS 6284]|uniref:Bud site selection protein 7 n=1 Tax=Henningerozyma blattae (strain ATCC 34711 / CBS 6284 / DSM 70876 / NBRC 10599 / NRRL Y-10934 / UCD 77-7) TaxID=1071380 RepID=I2GYH2_HENB6|nr:hypothetical protein TBLA_0B03330 [Tetrapisispora blattae CBS 6284]CCH59174.1 hypothetical protein TBLA_0B03330 [Tetrapisispora blattae CBS 6284]